MKDKKNYALFACVFVVGALISPFCFAEGESSNTDDGETAPRLLYDEIRSKFSGTVDKAIDLSSPATKTRYNGNGVSALVDTMRDEYPIFFYRGEVDNNYLIFNNFCWRILRTDKGGAIKIFYNGPANNGVCNNTGVDTVLDGSDLDPQTDSGTRYTETNYGGAFTTMGPGSPADVGYMYGTSYPYYFIRSYDSRLGQWGNDVTWDGEKYTIQVGESNSAKNYNCLNGSTTCETVYYTISHLTDDDDISMYKFSDGMTIESFMKESFSNKNDSYPKKIADRWYEDNMLNVSSRIEDVVYCSDRGYKSIRNHSSLAGKDVAGSLRFKFDGAFRNRLAAKITSSSPTTNYDGTQLTAPFYLENTVNYNNLQPTSGPTFDCGSKNDSFTVSSEKGNGALKYPVGLMTADEAVFFGEVPFSSRNNDRELVRKNYLEENRGDIESIWTMTPDDFYFAPLIYQYGGGFGLLSATGQDAAGYYTQPVIALKSDTCISSGEGTSTSPYLINGDNAPCAVPEDEPAEPEEVPGDIDNPNTSDEIIAGFVMLVATVAICVIAISHKAKRRL